MNEFIVWDNKFKKFLDGNDLRMNLGNGELHGKFSGGNVEEWKAFQYIGLKDTNNNKIYADSSIVEFDWKAISYENQKKMKGYIRFNKERLHYEIFCFNKYDTVLRYSQVKHELSNFKIIDTIQENKLGLIIEYRTITSIFKVNDR